ncbi:MAG: type II toxin-antitoxin system prevent-host-death family antitoxin [Betaproteobacteria bacterium]|nr:type II toxin-antitoxin system prevent-host-death family antitoxin [Betaproteobacteria bacterium]
MERIGIYDARSRLWELVGRVESGEEVVLTRRGRPVARRRRALDAKTNCLRWV